MAEANLGKIEETSRVFLSRNPASLSKPGKLTQIFQKGVIEQWVREEAFYKDTMLKQWRLRSNHVGKMVFRQIRDLSEEVKRVREGGNGIKKYLRDMRDGGLEFMSYTREELEELKGRRGERAEEIRVKEEA